MLLSTCWSKMKAANAMYIEHAQMADLALSMVIAALSHPTTEGHHIIILKYEERCKERKKEKPNKGR